MAKQEIVEAVEKTLDVVEETAETLERIPKLWLNGTTKKQQIVILSATALAGAAVGVTAAGTLIKRRLKTKYETLAEQEIDEARAYYHAMQKPDLESLAEERLGEEAPAVIAATSALKGYQGRVPYQTPEVLPQPEPQSAVTSNIFVDGKPMVEEDFDYEAEIATRSEDAPYVISQQEFMQGEKDYIQSTLTYYAGDDVLADDKDKDIPDSDDTVGDMNMHKFGHGSGDNNTVYIRNDRMGVDFEVVRSLQSFSKDVLGLRHADGRGSRKTPRFRGDDE